MSAARRIHVGVVHINESSSSRVDLLPFAGVKNSGLGQILVDSKGDTLYLFKKDSGTTSECSGGCATDWPPLRASGKPTVGSGATASAS